MINRTRTEKGLDLL